MMNGLKEQKCARHENESPGLKSSMETLRRGISSAEKIKVMLNPKQSGENY
jgi:hypothetical protein